MTAPATSNPHKVAVLDTRARGVGDGRLTLEAMEQQPAADGGVEAVVGAAQGKEPEVIATAEEDKTSKLSWIKQKLTPSVISDKSSGSGNVARSRSTSTLSRASRDDDGTDSPSPAVNPIPTITKGVPEMDEPVPQPTKVTTDGSGKPVPVDVGPLPADNGASAASLATSLRDDLSDQMDLDPSTSHAKFHSLFAGKIPEEEELIEGRFRDDEFERRAKSAELALPTDYRCALQRDILVQGRLFVVSSVEQHFHRKLG